MKNSINNLPFSSIGNVSFAGAKMTFEPLPAGVPVIFQSIQDLTINLKQNINMVFGMGGENAIDATWGTVEGEGSLTLLEGDLEKLRLSALSAGNPHSIVGLLGNAIVIAMSSNLLGALGVPRTMVIQNMIFQDDGWNGALNDTMKKSISFKFSGLKVY